MRARLSTVATASIGALALLATPGRGAEPALPLLAGVGAHHRDVGTAVADAQRYFDQGLTFAFGFQHRTAELSFREAARLDPSCAICFWGIALVLGPHINAPMDPGSVSPAWEAIRQATALAAKGGRGGPTPADRALIDALSQRYAADPAAERAPLDQAYAEAMRAAAARFPEDSDVLTLAAEALMDLHPWDLWEKNGTAKPWTGEIVALLEKALAVDPAHPGANHYYIHAVEASKSPGLARDAADRLQTLVPAAGHLVHMPSHVYIRLGRYWDAVEANRRAIEADRKTLSAQGCHGGPGFYELAYVPHNVHFGWAAATFAGASALATEKAREVARGIPQEAMRAPGYGVLQHLWMTPLFSAVRFGRWDEVLATPEPAADLPYPRALWRWARGIAHLRRGDVEAAAADLAALEAHAADPALDGVTFMDINTARGILAVALPHLAGELAYARRDPDAAFAHLARAIAAEDALTYDEPPPWALPIRQMAGALYLEAGRPAEAEATFRADLEVFAENGWSLFGLAQALRGQGKEREATEVDGRFARAFAHADVTLRAARF